jgi:hypothetical protein
MNLVLFAHLLRASFSAGTARKTLPELCPLASNRVIQDVTQSRGANLQVLQSGGMSIR